jgi:hypothetical protein
MWSLFYLVQTAPQQQIVASKILYFLFLFLGVTRTNYKTEFLLMATEHDVQCSGNERQN